MIAIAESMARVEIWDLRTTPAPLSDFKLGPFSSAKCMEFTRDSGSLLVCDLGSLSRWNVTTSERQWIYEDPSFCGTNLKLSPDQLTIVAFSNTRAYLIDTMTGCCRMNVGWPSCPPIDISPSEVFSIGHISFSDDVKIVLLYFNGIYQTDAVLAWDLTSSNIKLADSAILSNTSYIACFNMQLPGQRINYRGHDVFPISSREIFAAASNRIVLVQDDGQFTVIDFDDDKIGEI